MKLLRFVYACLSMIVACLMTPCSYNKLSGLQQIGISTIPYATAYGNGHKIAVTNSFFTDTIYVVYSSGDQTYCVTGILCSGYIPQWSSPINFSKTTGNAFSPAISLDTANVLHAVWRDTRDGQKEIYHTFLQDTTWSTPTNVSQTTGNSVMPSLDADGFGRLHLVYADSTSGNWEIYYQCYQNGSWNNPINISSDSGKSFYPSIGVYNDSVFICWEDNTLGNYEIFQRVYHDTIWSDIINISNSSFDSRHPSLSSPSSWDQGFSVIWKDSSSDGYSINVIGCNGGTVGDRTAIAEYPVISNVSTTWSYLAWEEGGYLFARTYYFMHGGWPLPDTIGFGGFPNVAGDNYVWTEDAGGSYNIIYAEAGYPIGVSGQPATPRKEPITVHVRPNPFKDKIHVSINVGKGQLLVFDVYDLTGRKIKAGSISLNRNEFEWDGRNDAGFNLPGGVYYIKVNTGVEQQIIKAIKIN